MFQISIIIIIIYYFFCLIIIFIIIIIIFIIYHCYYYHHHYYLYYHIIIVIIIIIIIIIIIVIQDVVKRLKQIYYSVEDIDLFTGGLSEVSQLKQQTTDHFLYGQLKKRTNIEKLFLKIMNMINK